MLEIARKIPELYGLLVKEIGKAKASEERIAAERVNLKEKEEKLDARVTDINVRETAVKVIEDVKALSDKTAEARRKLADDRGKLTAEISSFGNYSEQVKQENQALQSNLKASIEANERKATELEAATKKLSDHEKDLKLAEGIVAQLADIAKKQK